MEIIKYPDNSSYAKVGLYDNRFIFRINSYEDLWHLNQIVDALSHNSIWPEITIPNLLDAQADRRFSRYESSGLKLVCNLLSSMKATFKIFHPHNPEVVESLMENAVIIDNKDFIQKVFLEFFKRNWRYNEDLILMSADAGGFKPLVKLCDKLEWTEEIYSASKARNYDGNKSSLTQIVDREDFGGKDIMIVDDICVYGGTFKGLAKLLRERNCGKLYLAVSHMTIQNHENGELFKAFDHVFTTNSKYKDYWYLKSKTGFVSPENLTTIKLF